jgi:hippurate hydrolase
VIPQKVHLRGTIRTMSNATRELAEKSFISIVEGTATAFGATATVDFKRGYPVMVNSEDQTAFAAEVAKSVAGKCDFADQTMGGEDFAYMLEERPGAYIFVGNGDGADVHHPEYVFKDETMPAGCSWWAEIAEQRMPVG